jgi:hypothetical protein
MSKFDSNKEIGAILQADLYAQATPQVDGLRQVIDTLKDRVQPLSPIQLQAIGYLKHLANRNIHKDKKVYEMIIEQIYKERQNVAPPGFFIRIIEAITGGTKYVTHESTQQMKNEREGNK